MLVLLLTALIPTTARTVAGDSIAALFSYPLLSAYDVFIVDSAFILAITGPFAIS